MEREKLRKWLTEVLKTHDRVYLRVCKRGERTTDRKRRIERLGNGEFRSMTDTPGRPWYPSCFAVNGFGINGVENDLDRIINKMYTHDSSPPLEVVDFKFGGWFSWWKPLAGIKEESHDTGRSHEMAALSS